MEQHVSGQSYRWPRWTVCFPTDVETWSGNARIEWVRDGNHTRVEIIPDDDAPMAAIMPLRFDGEVRISKRSATENGKPPILALSSSGSWSGGSCYSGWIIGRKGARVVCDRKGQRRYFEVGPKGWFEDGPKGLTKQSA